MAIQLAHEIRAVPGIAFIPLPAEFQRMFVFSAGLASNVKELGAAKSLLQFLSGPEGMTVIRAKGMDPVARK
jgi:molybdate transport system substrate-binding protein